MVHRLSESGSLTHCTWDLKKHHLKVKKKHSKKYNVTWTLVTSHILSIIIMKIYMQRSSAQTGKNALRTDLQKLIDILFGHNPLCSDQTFVSCMVNLHQSQPTRSSGEQQEYAGVCSFTRRPFLSPTTGDRNRFLWQNCCPMLWVAASGVGTKLSLTISSICPPVRAHGKPTTRWPHW